MRKRVSARDRLTTPSKISAAVGASGTVAHDSQLPYGSTMAPSAPSNATRSDSPSSRAASQTKSALTTPRTHATTRAVASESPNSAIGMPYSQNGSGNQLVPLGSSDGSAAKRAAITTRE